MQIYILDPETAKEIAEFGYPLNKFNDINGVPIWEFSYTGDHLDIGALKETNKIIVYDNPPTIYL